MPEHLLDEERIALGLVVHGVDEALVARGACDAGDQVGELVGTEALEHDSLERMLAAKLAERLSQRVPCIHLGVPIGPDDQQRIGLQSDLTTCWSNSSVGRSAQWRSSMTRSPPGGRASSEAAASNNA